MGAKTGHLEGECAGGGWGEVNDLLHSTYRTPQIHSKYLKNQNKTNFLNLIRYTVNI